LGQFSLWNLDSVHCDDLTFLGSAGHQATGSLCPLGLLSADCCSSQATLAYLWPLHSPRSSGCSTGRPYSSSAPTWCCCAIGFSSPQHSSCFAPSFATSPVYFSHFSSFTPSLPSCIYSYMWALCASTIFLCLKQDGTQVFSVRC
jgi:hypothetical protein